MEKEYREVLENIRLTEEEALTLWKAAKIVSDALGLTFNYRGEIDKDLQECLNACLDGMRACYPRINVSTTCGEDYPWGK